MKTFGKELLTRKDLFFIKKHLSRETFVPWLFDNYEAIRCYHASRPEDVNSYYQGGFNPSNIDQALKKFEEFLQKVNYNARKDISDTIDTFRGKSDRFVYFILDKYDFYDLAPHYWIYGSEFMLCLAQNTAFHLKDYLRKIGTPTIFTCDIPLSIINKEELISLYDRIQQAKGTFNQMLYDVFFNYTIIIQPSLEGKFIIGHEHPTTRVQDLHAGGYYTNEITACPLCQR